MLCCGLLAVGRIRGAIGGSLFAVLGGTGAFDCLITRPQQFLRHAFRRLVAGGRQDDRPLELLQQLLTFGRGLIKSRLDDFRVEARARDVVIFLRERHVASDGQLPAGWQRRPFMQIGDRPAACRKRHTVFTRLSLIHI